ncbi:hypothetical protein HN018_06670 [Lichenicola cladoniae]|uniref:Uncharacterized protein n=1 Tax=Lichenicola cladoniae TaxID=1484109 RepID=A0A6M8HN77_9PROT|nr:hypothetical protein [Lichenicola cladoniae]NPD67255.1 hypothetical protein [Acetobacteraceae bacterium]QKE89761.1 hypothetical protein HN018_06670 [Lichenicola cladoniae]
MADRLPGWPRALSEELAASYVSLSVSTWRIEVSAHRAPQPFRLTPGRKAWLIDDLDTYVERLAGRLPAESGNEWLRALG